MSTDANPFRALGLPADPGLTDEQVHAAWRTIAAATHPDRPDGGDLARYTAAAAAYADLSTGWARSEVWADLAEHTGPPPAGPGIFLLAADPGPSPGQPPPGPVPPGQWPAILARLPGRIARGHPLRLLLRAAAAAALALLILHLIPGAPAAPADVTGVILWFLLTARADLAPPPEP